MKFNNVLVKFFSLGAFLLFASSPVFSGDMPSEADKPYSKNLSFQLDIPSQSLQEALLDIGEQSGYSIIFFRKDVVEGGQSSPIVGRFELTAALKILLGKSRLDFEIDPIKKVIHISKVEFAEASVERPTKRKASVKEEIQIVSARHRDESLYDVPMSVSQISGQDIEAAGIQDLIQVGNYIPNTNLRAIRGTNTSLAIFIRGVGHDDPVAGLETSVGVYIDDVYISRPQSVAIDLFDIERVEVLRGPQGTLYGRNTIGGAIKYVTKPLADEKELKIKGEVGSYNQRDVVLTAGIPFSSSLKVGGSFASFQRDGFGENVVTGEEHYNKNVLAFRSSIEYAPLENFLMRVSTDYTRDDSASRSGYLPDGTFGLPALAGDYDTRSSLSSSNHPVNENSIVIRGASSDMQWDINDLWRMKFISAYREDRSELPSDIDSHQALLGDGFTLYENKQLSHEMRFVYEGEDDNALLGFYYLNSTSMSVFDLPGVPVLIPGFPNLVGTVVGTFDEVDVDSWSSFATYSFDLREKLNVSLGLRYTNEKRELTVIRNAYTTTSSGESISPFFGGDGVSIAPFSEVLDESGREVWPTFVGVREDDAWTPNVSVSWQPKEDEINLYSTYSAGFKSGGFAPRGIFIDPGLRAGFRPEKMETLEAGLNVSFIDDNVQAQFALFQSRYQDMQLVENTLVDTNADGIGDAESEFVRNADKASIQGLEFSAQLSISPNWQTNISMGLMEAEFDRIISASGENIANERDFVSAPEVNVSLHQIYKWNASIGRFRIDGSLSYQSATTFFHVPSEPVDQPGYSLVNVGAHWFSGDEAWSLGLSILNVTDKRYRVSAFYQPEALGPGENTDLVSVFWGSPRTVSLSLAYQY